MLEIDDTGAREFQRLHPLERVLSTPSGLVTTDNGTVVSEWNHLAAATEMP
jgi:hypothetical protein